MDRFEEIKRKDPIPRFRKYLIGKKVLTEKEAGGINQEIAEELDEAVKFAGESPYPDPEEALTDVFV